MNKVVHFRPACNLLSTNEMACLWESKIGRTLPRVTLTKEDLLAMAAEDIIPASIVATIDECFDDYVRALDLEEEATENKKSNPPMVEILAVHPMCA
ncbi:hypothetical protein QYE76_069191 [Lolium multiflorum]|uniref:Uncharacterized protein n=1 Tax=Lolium multiflorum TaxID=4521 RepID=A0AAD8SHA1_LOLMU|nr:hypothetical protein QYE76_069191 [Lolium multiflorum]